jgi:hypothetical protein
VKFARLALFAGEDKVGVFMAFTLHNTIETNDNNANFFIHTKITKNKNLSSFYF